MTAPPYLRSGSRASQRSEAFQPLSDRLADFGRRVFLNEMKSWDRDFRLIGPTSAELSLGTNQNGSGLGVDEQLGDGAAGHPLRVSLNLFHHMGRLPRNGDLTGPVEGRLSIVG